MIEELAFHAGGPDPSRLGAVLFIRLKNPSASYQRHKKYTITKLKSDLSLYDPMQLMQPLK